MKFLKKTVFFIACLMCSYAFLACTDPLPNRFLVTKKDVATIMSSSTIAGYAVDSKQIMEYPLNDIVLHAINKQVQDFWQEYEEKCTENEDKKYYAFALLAKKHQLNTSAIKQSSEENALNCAFIIWGYALLIIHYQIINSI